MHELNYYMLVHIDESSLGCYKHASYMAKLHGPIETLENSSVHIHVRAFVTVYN